MTQDKGGVVFRALDRESGQGVVLRRLLPRGMDGNGLNRREADEYLAAAERLAAVRESGLRSVVGWGVDGVDGMPWLASEWADGESLASVLRRGQLTFEAGRMLVEQGLAVQVALDARAPGWRLATDPDSVVVLMGEEDFRFTWWVEPFPGPEGRARGVAVEIAGLLEVALGWRGKTLPAGAGGGLAEWIRRVRSERLTAAGAMAAMASTTGSVTSGGLEVPLRSTGGPRPQTRVLKVTELGLVKGKGRILAAVGMSLLVTGGVTGWLLLRNGGKGWDDLHERLSFAFSGRAERTELDGKKEFRSDQLKVVSKLEGRTVTFTGVLKKVEESGDPGSPRYLIFDGDDGQGHVRGRFWEGEEAPGLCKKDLDRKIGKQLKITGDVRVEAGSGRSVVHLNRAGQVELADPD